MIKYDLEELKQMDKNEIIELLIELQEQYEQLENKHYHPEDYEPIYCDYDF